MTARFRGAMFTTGVVLVTADLAFGQGRPFASANDARDRLQSVGIIVQDALKRRPGK